MFGNYSKETSLKFQLCVSTAVHRHLWRTWPIFTCLLKCQNLARNCFQDWPKYQEMVSPSVTNDKDINV